MYSKIRKYANYAYQGAKRYGPPALRFAKYALAKPKSVGSVISKMMPKKESRIENKFNDSVINATVIDNTGSFLIVLNGLVRGTTDQTRIASQISCKNLMWKYYLTCGAIFATVRICIVWDKQTSGTAPAWTTVFSLTSVVSPYNPSGKDRFVILSDKTYSLTPVNLPEIADKGFINLKGVNTRYISGANAGSVADIATGGLFMMAISNVGATQPFIVCDYRLKFTDD